LRHLKLQLPRATGGAALLACGAVFGQSVDSGAPEEVASTLREIVVTGARASLASAQDIKREKLEIMDAVQADDIQKLPDVSVAEALQRVTGVQLARDRGDGTGLTIRGLGLTETTLNGREIFTAGTGRGLEFADLPAELVAGMDVYKTASADHIEGGLGGRIDLRTRRPFDFKRREVAITARQVQGGLVDKSSGQFSLLLSDRWNISGAGEFGALLSVSRQKRAWREDQKTTGNPVARTAIFPGQTVYVPSGTTETTSLGDRERTGGSLVLQWRPRHNLELYAEGFATMFRTRQNSYQINALSSSTFAAGSAALFPGTSDVQRITWTNAPVSVLSFARDTLDRTQQGALGGVWTGEKLTLRGDLSMTRSLNTLFFSGLTLSTTAANFSQDLSSTIPSTSITGTNLLDPASYKVSGVAYRANRIEGRLPAMRLDADYSVADSWVQTLSTGLRWSERRASNYPGLIVGDASVSGISAADRSGASVANPYPDYFSGSTSIGNYLVADLSGARDAASLRTAYGVSSALPSAGSALGVWDIRERTLAVYGMATFKLPDWPLDGNMGLRFVHTGAMVSGAQSDPSSGGVLPINSHSDSNDALPSMNLRYQLARGWTLRAAASRTITRPDFNQLSPSLTLVPNSINPLQNQGSAGNPDLQPIRANHLDFAVERYVDRNTAYSATLFWKRVTGFVTSVSAPEVINGVTYQVTRPQNSLPADIRGAELAYQHFYEGLPAWLRGLGMQANYTLVDSQTVYPVLGGASAPLQNLSRNSFNLVGMLDRGPVSARIAYNWRSRFLSGVTQIVGVGGLPIYTRAYGWLDASLTYRMSEKVSFTLAGTNLLRTVRSSYYGSTTRPQSSWTNDTQVYLTAAVRF